MVNSYWKIPFFVLFFLSMASLVYGQAPAGNGKDSKVTVVDEFGNPVSGVSILEKGGRLLGQTDDEGTFVLSGPVASGSLICSHVGYYLRVVKPANNASITVRMKKRYLQDPGKTLVLYEEKAGKDVLGAVSSVYTPELVTTPTPLYLNALTGRLPGFYTQVTSGFRSAFITAITYNDLAGSLPTTDPARSFPGQATTNYDGNDNTEMYFNLRGQTPVTIVDGVQRDIYSLDPENIASVTVLKDALSTLLLGMKSSAGALEITTKKGVAGPPRFSFTAQYGVQSPLKTPKPLNSYQYAYLYNEALLNEGQTPVYSAEDFKAYQDGTSPYFYPDVNWYNTILKDQAPISKYNLSVSGGIPNARYFISLSYLNQQGLFKEARDVSYNTNLDYDRYIVSSDIDIDVTRDFTVSLQMFGRIQDGRQPGAGTANILNQLYSTPNNAYPVFNPDGSYGGTSVYTTNLYEMTTGSGYLLDNGRDLLANIDLKYKFSSWLPGLYAKAKVNVSATSTNLINRSKTEPVYSLGLSAAGDTTYTRFGSIINQSNSANITSLAQFFYAQAAVGYDSSVGKNHYGGMLFADLQNSTYQFELPEKYYNLAFTANYNYNHTYLAEVAVDYAGFDRYAPHHRFGLLYAGGVGWDIAQESFIKDRISWVKQLKLRATYGKTAYSNEGALGYFSWRSAYGQDGNVNYQAGVNYAAVFGIHELGLANVNATWEKAHKFDLGLDASLFNNHLKLTADYYHDIYYDLLEQRGASIALIGTSYPNENIGKNLYEGQELSVTYQNHVRNFNFFITANASRMKTEVLYMDELKQKYPWNRRTGKPVGQTFGYKADGLIQTEAKAEATATFAGTTVYPGDIKLEDLNHDGVINQFDETALGNTKPIIYYGATVGFNFKGVEFSVLLQGVKNITYQQTDYSFGSGGKDQGYSYLTGRWIPENAAKATYPRLTMGFNANNTPYLNNSSYWTRPGEYFRVRNIDIGYTIPYKITEKIKISELRFFANAENIFTRTPYDRLDPEVYNPTAYPMQRTITAGVNIKF